MIKIGPETDGLYFLTLFKTKDSKGNIEKGGILKVSK